MASAAEAAVRQWASQRIGALLQMPPSSCGEIVDNILAYDNADELKDFLKAFTEQSAESKVVGFVAELFDRRRAGSVARPVPEVYRTPLEDHGRSGAKGGRGRGRGDGGRGEAGKGKGREETFRRDDYAEREFPRMEMPMLPRKEGDKRMMVIDAASGRHKVLTNCLNCGKVVVEEEGWGPCLFCGNPLEVGDRAGLKHGDDRGYLESASEPKTKSSEASGLRGCTEEQKYNESFEKAVATKDRLLSYDRDAKKRTKVFDDATDWYSESVNPWLSERQRDEAIKKGSEEENRKREEKRKIHAKIDLFGRTVISADAKVEEEHSKKDKENFQTWTESVADKTRLLSMMEESHRGLGGANSQLSNESKQLYERLRASLHAAGKDRAPNLGQRGKEERAEKGAGKSKKAHRFQATGSTGRVEDGFASVSTKDFTRVGDRSLLPVEESPYGDADDKGQCLTMHQPWASLLVYGLKRAEGRGWGTNHRGRLWIHAAARIPEDLEVDTLEQTYRSLYESCGIPTPLLPSQSGGYPTSALLGCVDIEECWTKQQYADVLASNPGMPKEENDNEFVFWCLRPRTLVVPLKMGGENKIWRLPSSSLAAAQRGIQPMRWPAPADGEMALTGPALTARVETGGASGSGSAANSAAKVTVKAPEPRPSEIVAQSTSSMPWSFKDPGADTQRPLPPPVKVVSTGPSFDIWPSVAPKEVLQVVERDKDGADREAVVLQNGFVHLIGYIPSDLQQRFADELREVGMSSKGFFSERFDGVKVASGGVMRMYLGMHWNAGSQRWEKTRSNLDRETVADLPKLLADMYSEAVKRANREMLRGPNKKRKLTPFPEGQSPTAAVADFCPVSSTIQMHQEKTESQASISAGHPILGICIGDSFDLAYSSEAPGDARKPKILRLESGDVFLLGGESRMLWIGVNRVLPRSAPPSLRLIPGMLNVSLRVN